MDLNDTFYFAQVVEKGAKTDPKKLCVKILFAVHVWTLLGTPFQSVSWTPGPLKYVISLGMSFENAASHKSHLGKIFNEKRGRRVGVLS